MLKPQWHILTWENTAVYITSAQNWETRPRKGVQKMLKGAPILKQNSDYNI
jgi:hypothetical protein